MLRRTYCTDKNYSVEYLQRVFMEEELKTK